MEQDGSSDVTEFLARVKELGEKTNREDELRAKRLEEEILEGRKRRQALRAERARSLSPQKKYGNLEKDEGTREVLGVLNDLVGTTGKSPNASKIRPLKPSSEISAAKRQISSSRKVSGPRPGPKPVLQDKELRETVKDKSVAGSERKLSNTSSPVVSKQDIPTILTPRAENNSPLSRTLSTVTQPKSPYGSAMRHGSPGTSPSSGLSSPSANSPNNSTSPGLGSARLSRSPTRGGNSFIQSALLRRDNTIKSSPFSASPKLNGLFDSPIMLANPVVKTSPHSATSTAPLLGQRTLDPASFSESKTVTTTTPPYGAVRGSPLASSSIAENDVSEKLSSRSSPVAYSRDFEGKDEEPIKHSANTSTTVSSTLSTNSQPVPEKPPIHKKSFEVFAPKQSALDPSPDSRRWNSSRQTTWLESALKKNSPATPEAGLVRAGTLRGTPRSSSPTKFPPVSSTGLGYSPSVSRHRSTFSADLTRSPSDIVRERPMSYLGSTNRKSPLNDPSPPAVKDRPVVKDRPSSLDYLLNESPTTLERLESETDNHSKGDVSSKSIDSPVGERKISPSSSALFNSPSLRPSRPKPLAPKPTAEAIERLNSLRKTTTQKLALKDEEKERIEQTKAALRRSQTLQYNAPDMVKETILSAKHSLRQSSPVRMSDTLEHRIQKGEEEVKKNGSFQRQTEREAEPKSFTDNLASVLLSGPPQDLQSRTSLKKATTLDNSELSKNSAKLSHINRTRTRGPKRRLPRNIQSEPSSPLSGPQSVGPSKMSSNTGVISLQKRGAVDLKRSPPKPRKPSSSVRIPSRTTVAS
jgi:hypothetical protein